MYDQNRSEFNLNRILGILQKRRYAALGVGLAVLSLFTWGGFLWPKTFEASSTVFIEKSTLIDPLIKGIGVPGNVEESLRNLKNGITTRNIIERVIKKLDLDAGAKKAGQHGDLIKGIQRSLDVMTVKGGEGKGTDLFTIAYRGRDPRVVRDLVNTLVSEYIEESMRSRRTDASSVYEFIRKQIEEYRVKLDESDEAIREFREENPGLVPQNESALVSRIEALQTARMEAELKLKEQTRRKGNLQNQLSGEKELTVAFVSRDGTPLGRLGQLNNQLAMLLGKYTENYPEVVRVKVEIEELKRQIAQGRAQTRDPGSETAAINPIYQQLREELARTDAEVESLRARAAELARQERESQSRLGRMPKEQQKWVKLQRDRNVSQKIYDDLLQKLENAKVSKDLEMTDKYATFKVVDPAVLPLWPVQPNTIKLILLGIILGICSGIGAAVGLDHIDHSFKNEEDIESNLKVPVLASVPAIVTEADTLSAKELDRKVFGAAGAYLALIGLVLVREVLSRYMGIQIFNF